MNGEEVTVRTPQIATEDKLHSAESAAALLGIRPSTIRDWWRLGRLRRVKVGRLTRVRESELLAQIDAERPKQNEGNGHGRLHA